MSSIARMAIPLLMLVTVVFAKEARATAYTFDIDEGTNKAHTGEWTVVVSYVEATKKVLFRVDKGTGKSGQSTWDGWTWSIDATKKGNTITFSGKSDDPTDKNGKVVKGQAMEFKNGTLDATTQNISLDSVKPKGGGDYKVKSVVPVPPPGAPKGGKKVDSSVPKGNSLSFNSLSMTLSLSGSTITSTPDLFDPLLGASVLYPDFALAGYNSDINSYMFINTDLNRRLTMQSASASLQSSGISGLSYNVASNLLYGVLYDIQSDTGVSEFVDYVDGNFDPNSPIYDPLRTYFAIITPIDKLYSLTDGFTKSGLTGATDGHFLTTAQVPTPLPLLGVGAAFGYSRKLRKRIKTSKTPEVMSAIG
jgi:hypothetical protein